MISIQVVSREESWPTDVVGLVHVPVGVSLTARASDASSLPWEPLTVWGTSERSAQRPQTPGTSLTTINSSHYTEQYSSLEFMHEITFCRGIDGLFCSTRTFFNVSIVK